MGKGSPATPKVKSTHRLFRNLHGATSKAAASELDPEHSGKRATKMMAVPIMSAPGEAADGKSSQLATLKRLVVAVERMALSMAGVLFLLLVLVVGVITVLAVTSSKVSDSLDEISESVSPSRIATIPVNIVQGSGRMSMETMLQSMASAKQVFSTLATRDGDGAPRARMRESLGRCVY